MEQDPYLASPKFKIRRITSRNVLFGIYTWQVRFNELGYDGWDRVEDYLTVKHWCLDNWAESMEYELFYYNSAEVSRHFNPNWAYQTNLKERKYCLYFSDDAMSLFLLKWNN